MGVCKEMLSGRAAHRGRDGLQMENLAVRRGDSTVGRRVHCRGSGDGEPVLQGLGKGQQGPRLGVATV